MGSYGDVWLNCVQCGLRGKCVQDEFFNGAEPLTDCDFAGGPLCNACLKSGGIEGPLCNACLKSGGIEVGSSEGDDENRCGGDVWN